MQALLETTIQINRIFKNKKKDAINKFMREHDCYSSTYVLGEFKSNMINDFLTLYGIFRTENDITDVLERIAEVFEPRQKSRLINLVSNLQRDYGDDYAIIKEQLEDYPEKLLYRFNKGIDKELLNTTDCSRARAELDLENMVWLGNGVRCTQKCNQCDIELFWEQNRSLVCGLEKVPELNSKMKKPLQDLNEDGKIPKGNACRNLGDCIIALESLQLENGCVVTSNAADYSPICQTIGAHLEVIK